MVVSFLIFGAHAKPDSRPCELRPPSWRTSYFSLLAQREVTKRKAPSRPRSRGHPCPRDFASRLRGSLTVRPCTDSERARFLRAPLRAFPAPARRGREGPGSKRRARQSLPQKRLVLVLLLLGPSVTRRRADGQGPRYARVGAMDRAHSAAGQDVLSAEPRPPVAHPALCAGRGTEGVFSLVTFSCTSTAPQERRERRSRPEGRRAGCPESQKVTRRPGWPVRLTWM